MKKTPAKKTKTIKTEPINKYDWFDTENARLIILCALFGVFGVHKFAQHKTGQGILFILLDLTIIGILISFIWAFFNLISLTIKRDNKPANMILGAAFLITSVSVYPVLMGTEFLDSGTNAEKSLLQENLKCTNKKHSFDAFIDVYANKVKLFSDVLNTDNKTLTLPAILDSNKLKIYKKEYYAKGATYSSPDEMNATVKIELKKQFIDYHISGDFGNGFAEYKCEVK